MFPDPKQAVAEPALPQSKTVRKHIRGSSMLLAGRMISLGLNFGVQVLTVRYLVKSDYGAFAYALTLVSMGSSLSLFGLDKALSRYLPIYEEKEENQSLFGAIILTFASIVGIGLALGLLVLGFRGLLADRFVDDPLAISLLLILIWLAPVQALEKWFESMFAVFARVRAVFFRRYLLGPGMKLAAVLFVIVTGSNVYALAWGYLLGGLLGIGAYAMMLGTVLRKRPVFQHFNINTIRIPFREIYGFSTPLLYSDLAFMLRNNLTVMLLGYFHTTVSVAEFRAVVPVAHLNQVVMQSFTLLYTPLAARLYAQNDDRGINDLYWQTAVWISIMSFPVFVVSFSLARPVTILLFGHEYANSAPILAMLSLGYYFNAALGFNAHTLRVYGRIKYIVANTFVTMVIAVILSLLLIPRYGALGAAMSAAGTHIVQNILNHLGLLLGTSIQLFDWKYLRTYVSIIVAAGGLLVVEILVNPPVIIGLPLAGLVSLGVLLANRQALNIADTFPELMRLPLMKYLFPRSA